MVTTVHPQDSPHDELTTAFIHQEESGVGHDADKTRPDDFAELLLTHTKTALEMT